MRHIAATAPILYIPGDRPSLADDLARVHCTRPYNVAICLEDAVRAEDRPQARLRVAEALAGACEFPRHILIRPDSSESLRLLLEVAPMDRVAGFILPKASSKLLEEWLRLTGDKMIMPILETSVVLDLAGRTGIADLCASQRVRIPCARIGANDLLKLLGGLRRPRGQTIYDTPLARVIDDLIATFAPRGVPLSGPVFDQFSDIDTLSREARADADRGLFGKSAIHPCQLEVIWDAMLPSEHELEQARALMSSGAPAVFAMHGMMLESACHRPWAAQVLEIERLAVSTCLANEHPVFSGRAVLERR
jgi:citrate lyase beta subunit